MSASHPSLSQQNGSGLQLSRQLNWLLLLRVVLLTFLLGIISILESDNLTSPTPETIFYFIVAIYIFSIFSALISRKVKRITTFAYGQIIADSAFAAIIVYYSGGSHSMLTFIYFFPVISGGLLLFDRGGLIIASFCVVNYGIILACENKFIATRLPDYISHNPATDLNILLQNFSIYGLSFLLVGMLSTLLAKRLHLTEEALSKTSRDFDRLTQLYKQIFDDISSGIITVDTEGQITSFNKAAEEITGYRTSEIMHQHIGTIFPDLNPPNSSEYRPVMNITRKDTKKIPVGYSWARLNMPGDSEGYRVYTLQDLSKIKAMEVQVKQSEKMAAIGEIAAGIAHEFRNPLAAISGATQILQQGMKTDGTNQSLLNIITRECARLENNINDFLQFSKPAVPEKVWLSLKNQLEETWLLIQHGGKYNDCHLETNIQPNLDCWADQHQLKQVLINLVHNACLATDSCGTITVSAIEVKGGLTRPHIKISIKDKGGGIAPEILKNIFAPFYTTRENGTGLGLAIVKQIIEGHNGRVEVNSKPGNGSEFSVYLPMPK